MAKSVLDEMGSPYERRHVFDYVHCMSSGPRWNLPLYGTPSTSRQFDKRHLVPGLGMGIRVAFLARNADALGLLLGGRLPAMTVDPKTGSAKSSDSSRGLVWLPPAAIKDGELTCEDPWSDGSTSLDPPPELFELTEAAA